MKAAKVQPGISVLWFDPRAGQRVAHRVTERLDHDGKVGLFLSPGPGRLKVRWWGNPGDEITVVPPTTKGQ